MCGIIGYIGRRNADAPILNGLRHLEYRGYDSAGMATVHRNRFLIAKCKGKINNLENILSRRKLYGNIGLGHTRWATHGKPSKINAHPHLDKSKKIIIVHNGIIENFAELKDRLQKKGFVFRSETDTEVAAHLIGACYKGDLKEAVTKALKAIRGSFALGVMCVDEPDKIIAARRDSPLIIGFGRNENFIASDASAILEYTSRVAYLNDDETAVVTEKGADIFDAKGKRMPIKIETVSHNVEQARKGKFGHFMLKEIHEQPDVLSRILSHYVRTPGRISFGPSFLKDDYLKKIDHVVIIGCGTAYHAGLIGKYAIEYFSRIHVSADMGSEFRYRRPVIKKGSLVIAISQSGETADTLAAVRQARRNNARILSICNVLGSSLTRESDAVIYTQAGPEISVASTKAYTAQLLILYLFGLYLAGVRNTLSGKNIRLYLDSLAAMPAKLNKILKNVKAIKAIAKKHLHFGAFLYLGRNINFPTALEGALKLKEISYIPSEGYAAGEMKHGAIALIDEYRAVVCIANDSFVLDKMASNMQEILARQGKIIAIVTESNKCVGKALKEVIRIPESEDIFSPILTIVPLQLLAYFIAALKGHDVDRPRNLAKSVTVE